MQIPGVRLCRGLSLLTCCECVSLCPVFESTDLISAVQLPIEDVQTFGALIEGLEFVSLLITRGALFDKLYLQTLDGWEGEWVHKEQLMQSIVRLYNAVLTFLSKSITRMGTHVDETTDLNMDMYVLKMKEEKATVDEITGEIESSCGCDSFVNAISVH